MRLSGNTKRAKRKAYCRGISWQVFSSEYDKGCWTGIYLRKLGDRYDRYHLKVAEIYAAIKAAY